MSEFSGYSRDPMLEMFLFETNQLIEQLEERLIESEKRNKISEDDVNEIFRIMHTIKGSSSMMMFSEVAGAAHAIEDLFQIIRESNKDYNSREVCEYALKSLDFIRTEVEKIENDKEADGNSQKLAEEIRIFIKRLKGDLNSSDEKQNGDSNNQAKSKDLEKQKFYVASAKVLDGKFQNNFVVKVKYSDDCQMENVRAYTLIHSLKDRCSKLYFRPANLLEGDGATEFIQKNGFDIYITSEIQETDVLKVLDEALFVERYTVSIVDSYLDEIMDILGDFNEDNEGDNPESEAQIDDVPCEEKDQGASKVAAKQNVISVNVRKLDKLMDLVGEIVITESMVTRNPDLNGLLLENFNKAARQLRKLTDELQDIVMSIRMVPVAGAFHKMNRIVRDMSKSLGKNVELEIFGEETEVDKNIIDNLSDPLMHLIRNSMDHGIETEEERNNVGKKPVARIRLEAQNTGGDVLITVSDDGRGLDREQILRKARERNILVKPETEMTDKEVYLLILLPGFSTKEKVTEFSGRGVGMDVVKKNIEKLGGSIGIESEEGKGSSVAIRIPLTLAIVDGMEVSVGKSIYTVPTVSIKESFKANLRDIIQDTEGNEMIMIRGNCYPIVRLHKLFNEKTKVTDLSAGIMVMTEEHGQCVVLFADELLGEQQVVVKPLPMYLGRYGVKDCGVGGCTILGDGNISLILDAMGIIQKVL